MATMWTGLTKLTNFILQTSKLTTCRFQEMRNTYIGCRMLRDMKRRKMAKDYAPERLRLVAMKRNDILPIEIRNLVGKQIDETIPRQTALRQLTPRCILTSRPRGVIYRYRLSRIVFRDLADYNKLSGVQRAIW